MRIDQAVDPKSFKERMTSPPVSKHMVWADTSNELRVRVNRPLEPIFVVTKGKMALWIPGFFIPCLAFNFRKHRRPKEIECLITDLNIIFVTRAFHLDRALSVVHRESGIVPVVTDVDDDVWFVVDDGLRDPGNVNKWNPFADLRIWNQEMATCG